MKSDGGLSDEEIDEYVVRGYITDADGAALKRLDGSQQADYLEAVVELNQSRKDRGHPQ